MNKYVQYLMLIIFVVAPAASNKYMSRNQLITARRAGGCIVFLQQLATLCTCHVSDCMHGGGSVNIVRPRQRLLMAPFNANFSPFILCRCSTRSSEHLCTFLEMTLLWANEQLHIWTMKKARSSTRVIGDPINPLKKRILYIQPT